jgi:hypothetical protein
MFRNKLEKVVLAGLGTLVLLAALPVPLAMADGDIACQRYVTGFINLNNDNDWWHFSGTQGQTITLVMESTSGDLDPFLNLYVQVGSEWHVLVENDDISSSNRNARILNFTLPYTNNNYVIGATRYSGSASSGSYKLTMGCVDGNNLYDSASSDSDRDGLSNDMEQWLVDNFKPVLVFDEEEDDCIYDVSSQTATVYQVTPYETVDRYSKSGALITFVILYPEDCGGMSTSMTGWPFHAHDGDTEALRIFVYENPIDGAWYIGKILMRRHDESEWSAHDPDEFTFAQDHITGLYTHPYVYVSESKHAMYKSADACEDYTFFYIPWVSDFEDCDGGTILRLATPFSHNVGEREARAFDQFSESSSSILRNLFWVESAWSNGRFCGGKDISVSECAGPASGKWWPPVDNNSCNWGERCAAIDWGSKNQIDQAIVDW